MLRPFWRALFALAAALVAFAVTGRASADEGDGLVSPRIPASRVAPPATERRAPERPAEAYLCDRRGATRRAAPVRLDRAEQSVTAATQAVCEGPAVAAPRDAVDPLPPAKRPLSAAEGLFAVLPSVLAPVAPKEAPQGPFGATAARGPLAGVHLLVDRPPRA